MHKDDLDTTLGRKKTSTDYYVCMSNRTAQGLSLLGALFDSLNYKEGFYENKHKLSYTYSQSNLKRKTHAKF